MKEKKEEKSETRLRTNLGIDKSESKKFDPEESKSEDTNGGK